MSRVVASKTVKQASLNLKDMIDKKSVGLELTDLEGFGFDHETHWNVVQDKPELIKTLIDQVKALFDVGKEVKGFSAHYYPPAYINDKKFTSSEVHIPALKEKLGARFVIITGSREIANLSVNTGGMSADSPVLISSGDCMFMKITVGPVLNITFKNLHSEKLPPRPGFRETIVRKTPQTRHIFVIDAHVEFEEVLHKVKNDFLGSGYSKEKTDKMVDMVAEMARK